MSIDNQDWTPVGSEPVEDGNRVRVTPSDMGALKDAVTKLAVRVGIIGLVILAFGIGFFSRLDGAFGAVSVSIGIAVTVLGLIIWILPKLLMGAAKKSEG